MLDRRLNDGQRAWFEACTIVQERAAHGRRARVPAPREESSDFKLRIEARFDAAKELEHVTVAQKDGRVALVAAAACPPRFRRHLELLFDRFASDFPALGWGLAGI